MPLEDIERRFFADCARLFLTPLSGAAFALNGCHSVSFISGGFGSRRGIGGDPTEVALRCRAGAGDSPDSAVFQRRAQRDRNHAEGRNERDNSPESQGLSRWSGTWPLEWRSEMVMRPWMILPVGTQGLEPWTDEL